MHRCHAYPHYPDTRHVIFETGDADGSNALFVASCYKGLYAQSDNFFIRVKPWTRVIFSDITTCITNNSKVYSEYFWSVVFFFNHFAVDFSSVG